MDGNHIHCRKIGCTAETLRRWVHQHERDTGQRPVTMTPEQERMVLSDLTPSQMLNEYQYTACRCRNEETTA